MKTPEEIAKEIAHLDDWSEWLGQGCYIKPETLAMHIAAAIREAEVRGAEAMQEQAARAAEKQYRCEPDHLMSSHGGEAAARWLAKEIGELPDPRPLMRPTSPLVDSIYQWLNLAKQSKAAKEQAKKLAQTILRQLGPHRLYVGGRAEGPFVQALKSVTGTAYLKGYNFGSETDEPLDI
jgi:hypothetical protein